MHNCCCLQPFASDLLYLFKRFSQDFVQHLYILSTLSMSDIPNDLAVASEFAIQDLPPAPVKVEAAKLEQPEASNAIDPMKIEEASSTTQDAKNDPVSKIAEIYAYKNNSSI